MDTSTDLFGQQRNDPSSGRESIVDVRTLETIETHATDLTNAEQQPQTSALEAALRSGEEWPNPLIIEMSRVMDDGEAVWQVTTCDTETNEHSVMILP